MLRIFKVGLLLQAVLTTSCSSGGGNHSAPGNAPASAACAAYCGDVCSLLAECPEADTTDCVERCAQGIDADSCRAAEPADRLTCAQAQDLVACSAYCDTLCKAAASCATLDEAACRRGCAEDPPFVCNERSVEPRGCDAIKSEAICYETNGRDDGRSCTRVTSNELCTGNGDCFVGACNLDTNLCGPCQDDAACNESEDDRYACEMGECKFASCVRDDQCFGGDHCSLATHECVECAQDDHCVSGKCNESSNRCEGCGDDEDCSFSEPRCEPQQHECVQCLIDNDCDEGICDPSTHTCRGCKSARDCQYMLSAVGEVCDLTINECVQCLQDADCNSPIGYSNRCDVTRRACVQCLSNIDCVNGGFGAADTCDPSTQKCVEAPGN